MVVCPKIKITFCAFLVDSVELQIHMKVPLYPYLLSNPKKHFAKLPVSAGKGHKAIVVNPFKFRL